MLVLLLVKRFLSSEYKGIANDKSPGEMNASKCTFNLSTSCYISICTQALMNFADIAEDWAL